MSLSLRSTALATAVCDAGVRVYTKTCDGDVREGCNDTSISMLNQAKLRNDYHTVDMGDGWFPGELRFKCSPESTLCSFAWDTWSQSVFYQTEDGAIHERRHLDSWQATDFVQPDCMVGTSIAAVWGHYARVIVLFFQDIESYICFRVFHFGHGSWLPSVRLQKAAKCTGIGTTSWNNCRDIRVYFQDENNIIREYGGNYSSEDWWLGDFQLQCTAPVGDIAAVNWNAFGQREIRLYLQDEDCDIVEWCYTSALGWRPGEFRHPALPNSDIVAYVREPGPAHFLVVMWAGPDELLYQRVDPAGWGWMDATPIAFLQATGRFMGKFIGAPFTDETAGSDQRAIKQVNIRCGDLINAISLKFTDGSSTNWHGGRGGERHAFNLGRDEDIMQVSVTANGGSISGLLFITSKGRESGWFGHKTGQTVIWSMDGYALGGFAGAEGHCIHGLMPIWSKRHGKITLTDLQSCIMEADCIGREIELAGKRCRAMRMQTNDLQRDIENSLRGSADYALQGLAVLSESIENLYNQTKAITFQQENNLIFGPKAYMYNTLMYAQSSPPVLARRKVEVDVLVQVCKSQALVVHKRFQVLYDQSDKLRKRGSVLNTDLTAQLGASDRKFRKLQNLQEVADGLKRSAEARAFTARERRENAEQSQWKAEQTRKEARKKRSNAETARIVRDIFTFGLGEIWDWGGLNKAIDYANKLVESCQRNVEAAREDIQVAEKNLREVHDEIGRFCTLKTSISSHTHTLQATRTLAIMLRDKNLDLTNKAFDISVYLGGLVARTETVQTKLTAAQFARAILSIEQLLLTPTRVKGLIRDRPEELENTMEMIAQSDEVADDIGDIM